MAMQTLPAVGVAPEPRWPSEYLCQVVTSDVTTVEFGIEIADSEIVLQGDVLAMRRGAKLKFAKSGPGLKSGTNYLRVLRTSEPSGNLWLTQTGEPDKPSTQIFIDQRSKDHPVAASAPQASGYCKVLTGEVRK